MPTPTVDVFTYSVGSICARHKDHEEVHVVACRVKLHAIVVTRDVHLVLSLRVQLC